MYNGAALLRETGQTGFESACKAAANNGPLVVLIATRIRCDAILIETDGITSVSLEKLQMDDIVHHVKTTHKVRLSENVSESEPPRRHAQCMEWLWDTIASPVLKALGFDDRPGNSAHSAWPRIWWIPTGVLSQLPIHAAGLHGRHRNESVIDRAISSYSPSIMELVQTRRKTRGEYDFSGNHLLVSMVSTPGLSSLPEAGKEIDEVARLSSNTTGQIVTLEDPTKNEVLHHTANADIVHFAGHGISHPLDPLRSCIVLKDWQEDPLTVEDILLLNGRERKRNSTPFLAYLSACSTGQNLAHDLVDESISLMSAFHIIGFRHTVATLWEMTDELLIKAAKRFYTELRQAGRVTDDTIAWSVHSTTRYLRDSAESNQAGLADWPAYVHSGP